MRITRLQAANVKRLTAIDITPHGSTVVIGGMNGEGKSSTLDAIMMALAGKGAVCERPLRDGTDKGFSRVELDNELAVTRTFGRDGATTITVGSIDGTAKYTSPQGILDKLFNKLTFDPLAFVEKMDSHKQLETLRALVGLDLRSLDARRKKLYDDRAEAGRDVQGRQSQIDAMPLHDGLPATEESLTAVAQELQAANEHNNACAEIKSRPNTITMDIQIEQAKVAKAAKTIADLRTKIQEWERYADNANSNVAALNASLAEANALAESAQPTDTDAIVARMGAVEARNKLIRENKTRASMVAQFTEAKATYDDLTAEIAKVDEAKAAAIAAAHFPVAGLGFGADGVTYKGLPFDQASSAEKLRVSVAMALAMNPKLKVLLIRDGSLLDDKNLAMVGEMAEAAGAQIWIERVGEGAECSVIIEDGTVKTHETTPEEVEAEQVQDRTDAAAGEPSIFDEPAQSIDDLPFASKE